MQIGDTILCQTGQEGKKIFENSTQMIAKQVQYCKSKNNLRRFQPENGRKLKNSQSQIKLTGSHSKRV